VTLAGQRVVQRCRCKVRMSGLSKVEMSAFIGGRGRYGSGANHLEPTRTGPVTGAKRNKAEAPHPDGSGSTAKDQRSAHPAIAGGGGPARRPRGGSPLTRRASNRKLSPRWELKIMSRVRQRYADFGPTLAAEHLAQEGLAVSRESTETRHGSRPGVGRIYSGWGV
jgi:hypothetical protein